MPHAAPSHDNGHHAPPDAQRAAQRTADSKRPGARQRGYDRNWEKLRARKLAADPLCEHCLKERRTEPATDVDHIIPIVDWPEGRLVWSNLQSLCGLHHRRKTAKDRMARKISTAPARTKRTGGSGIVEGGQPRTNARTRAHFCQANAGVADGRGPR